MGSLSGIFGASTRSLLSYSEALAVVQENIANAATPGYARQRPVLTPITTPDGDQRFGVEVSRVQLLRDRLLDVQVLHATQSRAYFEERAGVLQRTELQFPLSGETSVGSAIDLFFGAVSELSVAPTDLTLRRTVLSAANGVAVSVRNTSTAVERQRFDLDSEVRSSVIRINSLLERVAELAETREAPDATRPNAARRTQLNQTLEELSELIDFSLVEQSDGTLTLIGGDGVALVVGSRFRTFSVSATIDRLAIVDDDGSDVTASLQTERGSLAALLQARNVVLPGFLADLNRLAKSLADRVNEQLARGADLAGQPGQALFAYQESAVLGAGRTAGTNGAATPSPPDSIQIDFSGGVTGTINASLPSFVVAAAPPAPPSAGDTVSITFTSDDGSLTGAVTTAPLLGGEGTAALALRLNDRIALEPQLRGLVSFADAGNGNLKVVLSEQAGRGFDFTVTTSNLSFTTGLEPGGTLGGGSAEEIAAALNAAVSQQAAADPIFAAARIRFAAVGGEVKIDGDVAFDFVVTETPGATVDALGNPDATGFSSGLPANGTAGGARAAFTLGLSGITPAELAAGTPALPDSNDNALWLQTLADAAVIDGLRFSDFYSLLVNQVGDEAQTAASQAETQEQILLSAQNLRDSLSGVDLNEEAIRLLELEQAFQAMLRVVKVVDELTMEVMGLVR
jgi:flagellar hook-associated protein 1 FlgK